MSGFLSEVEQQFDGQSNNQSSGQDQQQTSTDQSSNSNSGSGFMGKAETVGKDAMLDQEVNTFATKEGLPAGADGFVDNEVNQEFNKFT